MSLHLPTRRLLRPTSTSPLLAVFAVRRAGSPQPCSLQTQTQVQHRRINWWGKKSPSKSLTPSSDPSGQLSSNPELRKKVAAGSKKLRPEERLASRVEGGIFASEIQEAEEKASLARREQQKKQSGTAAERAGVPEVIDPRHSVLHLDPDPRARIRWERKKVIQMVHRQGRTTKAERILMSERKIMMRSPWLFTSTKKLGMLTRQIAGKTVDDAMVQMRFSPKKFAKHVLRHLELSKNMAIAKKGMGLGKANGEAPLEKPQLIETKNKKSLVITDPTRLYIDEAWVNRGKYTFSRMYRHGLGRKSAQFSPSASMTVVLKEEKTRVRLHREREIKKIQAKPWVHLPDRPVTAQRPYYSW